MATLPPIARPPRPRGDWNADRFELHKWFDLVWRHLGGKTSSSSDPAIPPIVLPPIVVATEIAYPDIIIPSRVLADTVTSYEVVAAVDTTISSACGIGEVAILLPTVTSYQAEICIKHIGIMNLIRVNSQLGQVIEGVPQFVVYPGESINVRVIDGKWWVV